MGLFDKIKGAFTKPEPEKVVKEKKPREKKAPELTLKEKATQAGEPYINVIGMELNPENIHEGSFELDWNSIFITQLVKAGYMKKKEDTDQDIVDRWFQDVCRTIVLEMYEQSIADPDNRNDMRTIFNKDLGNGRTEVS
jgi:hypothetical protein